MPTPTTATGASIDELVDHDPVDFSAPEMNIKSDTQEILDDIEPYKPKVKITMPPKEEKTEVDSGEDAAATPTPPAESEANPDETKSESAPEATSTDVPAVDSPAPQLAHRRHERLKALRARREKRLKDEAQARQDKERSDKLHSKKTVLPFAEDGWAGDDPVHPAPPGKVRIFLEGCADCVSKFLNGVVHFLGFHQGKEVFPLFFSKERKDDARHSYLHTPAHRQEHLLWRSGHQEDADHLAGHEDEHFVNFAARTTANTLHT
jgi:hypothetical protein